MNQTNTLFSQRTLTLHFNNISHLLTVQENDKIIVVLVFVFLGILRGIPKGDHHNSTLPFSSSSVYHIHPDMAQDSR